MASFAIRNDGYLKITNVEPSCFIWKMSGFSSATNELSRGNAGMDTVKELHPTETMTVPCGIVMIGPIQSIDLGVIIHYHPWPLTFLRQRRVFRFVVKPGEGKELNWYEQPSADLEKALNEFLAH
jgi:hypothetical protein